MGLDQIRDDCHRAALRALAIDRIVQTRDFAEAYKADPDGIDSAIKSPSKLREWVKRRICDELELLPFAQLRNLAAAYHIPLYSRMNKEELIRSLHATSMVQRRKSTTGHEAASS